MQGRRIFDIIPRKANPLTLNIRITLLSFRNKPITAGVLFASYAIAFLIVGCGGKTDENSQSPNPFVSGEELQSRLGTADAPLILDVRTSGEYTSGHIPGAIHIPHSQLAMRLQELEEFKEREIVVYCARGPRAYNAEAILREAGFGKVRHLRGDITGWRRDGRPISK